MRAAGTGTLVGIASVAGFRGIPGSGAYSASKAAAATYLESLRVELRGSGISVVTISPGYIATPLTEHNPYPMPFILPANVAARRMANAIARRMVVAPHRGGGQAQFVERAVPERTDDGPHRRCGALHRPRPHRPVMEKDRLDAGLYELPAPSPAAATIGDPAVSDHPRDTA